MSRRSTRRKRRLERKRLARKVRRAHRNLFPPEVLTDSIRITEMWHVNMRPGEEPKRVYSRWDGKAWQPMCRDLPTAPETRG